MFPRPDRLVRPLLLRIGLAKKESGGADAPSGIPFTDVQRRIDLYLRALWGTEFVTKQNSRPFENREGYKPFVENGFIHLPHSYGEGALHLYRAAAVHAAAHIVYGGEPITAQSCDNWQIAVICAIEDARVESLAIRRFPGLETLWKRLHTANPDRGKTAGDYLDRLARALLDETYRDGDPWVEEGRALFLASDPESSRISAEIGLRLAQSFLEKKIPYDLRTDLPSAPYRDDNRYFRESGKTVPVRPFKSKRKVLHRIRKYASLFGMTDDVAEESVGEQTRKRSMLAALFNFKLDFGILNDQEGKEKASEIFHYPEWDYLTQTERPSWAAVYEMIPRKGELAVIDEIIEKHKRLISRMKYLLDAIQPEGVQRIRKLEEGDEIDINAAIRAQVDIKLGIVPDTRIMMSSIRKNRDISVLVLLDLSKSTSQKVAGQEHTVLQLTQQACVLLSDAISKVGDPFAIHGFCSDSRHHVEYYRFKDFDQPYDDLPKARIAGMMGQLSTRMGTAIRHAAHYLKQQKSSKKLLMVITDGEPSDVDVRDHKYLRFDAKKAVEEAARSGIHTYCMSLDRSADQYVSRIFGARNYMVVDHVARLPEKLPLLYAGLTR